MKWTVIIKRGQYLNLTLATVLYDKFGTLTKQPYIICDTWDDGFAQAQQQGHEYALFVDSGTTFTDWPKWCALIDSYPQQGLVAHIIWHPDSKPYLHDQCWFMCLQDFALDDLDNSIVEYVQPIRSSTNIHDNYTPTWIRPGVGTTTTNGLFGQRMIAQQLNKGRAVVNWNNHARDLKKFTYSNPPDLTQFADYIALSENQLWVLNNEPVKSAGVANLVTPGSGMFWILNAIDSRTSTIQIVDISRVQVEFCQALWHSWNGVDYGSFVWQHIKHNNLAHYELDVANMSDIERLKLSSPTRFIEYVSARFYSTVPDNFVELWQAAKHKVQVEFTCGNLVEWIIAGNKYDNVWSSNILNYKWTMLHCTQEQTDRYKDLVKC
jgi:hypothetical protein